MASLISGYNYDVFISYRQKDNKYDCWVSEFVENLRNELEGAFKDEVEVFHDINPHDGLLETYDVSASLGNKLKCLIFIPILSRTYCDPKSFAWSHEFKAFIEQASGDKFGLKITLENGNVASRVLPIRIHDLFPCDIKQFEEASGLVLRSIDFIYHDIGVSRQLRAKDDDHIKNQNQTLYRDQINKVALAIRDLIERMRESDIKKEIHKPIDFQKPVSMINGDLNIQTINIKNPKDRIPRLSRKARILVYSFIGIVFVIASMFFSFNRLSKTILPQDGKNYALIVCINNYADPGIEDLDKPIEDAQGFYDVITSRYTFDKKNIRLLRNATTAEIVNALKYYAEIVLPADNFLIFYEGHGNWDASSQDGCWILADAKRDNKSDWFKNSTLRDYIRDIKSKHTLLISNACFDGLVFESRVASSTPPISFEKLYNAPSRKAITSGIRIVVPQNNVFADVLIERLKKNKQRYLSSQKLYANFLDEVTEVSSKVPQYGVIKSAGDEDGDFIFILK